MTAMTSITKDVISHGSNLTIVRKDQSQKPCLGIVCSLLLFFGVSMV
jgi:hypothetical protein